MNKLLSILALGFLFIACNDDNKGEEIIPPGLWEQPHRQMMDLKGSVTHVVESASEWTSTEEDVEEFTLAEYSFDAVGRLTYYNPTGINPVPSTRWVGVSAAYYEYQYDKEGRLSKATVHEVGEDPRQYQITYGNHDCYIPLIFPLGPFNFFLVKGVESIETLDGSIRYHFDGSKASYSASSWGKSTETSFYYEKGSCYPLRQQIIVMRNEETLSETNTTYTFSADGNLLATLRKMQEDGGEEETLETSYLRNRFLQIDGMISSQLDTTIEWRYTYDSKFQLVGITLKHNGEETGEEETNSYLTVDATGNWTESKQVLNSNIDSSHFDATMRVKRAITY